jgi:hypothetical protein
VSANIKDQIKAALWDLIEEHYNLDRKSPQILTAKKLLLGKNPIDDISDRFADLIEQIIESARDSRSAYESEEYSSASSKKYEQEEEEEYSNVDSQYDPDYEVDYLWAIRGED